MNNLTQLERLIGVRKNSDFLNPKLIDVNDFGFPKAVALAWTSDVIPTMKDRIMVSAPAPRVLIMDHYAGKTVGKYKKIHMTLNRIVSERRSIEPSFEYSLHLEKMDKLPSSRLSVFDYSEITGLYKYQHNRLSEYAMLYNKWETIFANVSNNVLTIRPIMIMIDLPDTLVKYSDIKRY